MAMTQKITITDNSGDVHSTSDSIMTKMEATVSSMSSLVAMIESSTAEGTLVSESVLSDNGKGVVITRVWDDASWTNFQALEGAESSDFSDAGWTVVTEHNTHMGLRTRQDDTFGE